MPLLLILAGLSLLFFVIYFFYNGCTRRKYLLTVIYLIPFISFGVTPFDYGALTVFHIMSFIAFLFLSRDFISWGKDYKGYLHLFFLLITLLVIGALNSEFPIRSLFGILAFIPPFIYGRILFKELKENERFTIEILKAIKITIAIAVVFMVIQRKLGPLFSFYPEVNSNVWNGGNVRYAGYFPDSQVNTLFFAMLSFICLLNPYTPKSPKLSNYIFFVIVLGTVLLAGARSPLIGMALGLAILFIFVGGNFRTMSMIFGVFVAIGLFMFSDSLAIFERFGDVDESYDFRAQIWKGAWEIVDKHPFFGIGVNNYEDNARLHAQDQFLSVEWGQIMFLNQPESGYLKVLTEFGWPASIVLVFIIIGPFITLFNNFFKGKKVLFGFFFLAPTIGWLFAFITVYNLGDSRIVVLLVTFLTFIVAFQPDPEINHD